MTARDRHLKIAFNLSLSTADEKIDSSQIVGIFNMGPESLLGSVLAHLKKIENEDNENPKSILDRALPQVKDLYQKVMRKDKTYKVIVFSDYASVLIFQKLGTDLFTHVHLVYCSKWHMNWDLTEKQAMQFSNSQPEYEIVFIGEIPNTESLQNIVVKFQLAHKEIKKLMVTLSKKYNPSNPTQLIFECTQTLQKMINYKIDSNILNQLKKHMDKCDQFEPSFNFKLKQSNGNQVGNKYTMASWAILWGLFYFLAQDNQLIQILSLDYKVNLLRQSCRDEFQKVPIPSYSCLKPAITFFVLCYQQIRSQIEKILTTNNFYFSNQKSNKVMIEIGQLIHKLDRPYKESKYKRQQMGRHYRIPQLQINSNTLVPAISAAKNTQKQSLKGQSLRYVVSMENIFDDLIKKYQVINKNENQQFLWLLAVEDTIFTLAFNQLLMKKPFSKFHVSLVKNEQRTYGGPSENTLSKLFKCYYQKLSQKKQKFTYGLKCQTYSHIQLVKTILCIIGFEIFKKENQNTIYDIKQFRIPVDHNKLYNEFNSLSHKARKAMQAIYTYCQFHKKKQDFFNQTKGYNNFKIYAEKVALKSQKIKSELQKKLNKLNIQKQYLKKTIKQFHENVSERRKELHSLQKKQCKCYEVEEQQQLSGRAIHGYLKKKKVVCDRCKEIANIRLQISKLMEKTQRQIQTTNPSSDGLVHQFFYCLNPFIEGLITLALMVQHNHIDTDHLERFDNNTKTKQIFVFKNKELLIKTQPRPSQQFLLCQKTEKDVDNLIKYSRDRLELFWNDRQTPTIIYKHMSYDQYKSNQINQGLYKQFQFFLQNPPIDPGQIREHSVYAKMTHKHAQINLDQFLALGTTRVSLYLQLSMCLKGLLERKITIDLQSQNFQFVKYIVYRSLSSMETTKPQRLNHKSNSNLDDASRYNFVYFMKNYCDQWKNQDFISLPFTGPILSMITRVINDEANDVKKFSFTFSSSQIDTSQIKPRKVIKKVLKKIKDQFDRLQKDIMESSQNQSSQAINKNRQSQYYICFGGICCFTQLILNDQDDTVIDFLKLLVMMKLKETFFGDLKDRHGSKLQKIVKKYSVFKFIAIENNIRVAYKYIQNNSNKLTQIVQLVDETIQKQIRWIKDEEGPYVFRGTDCRDNVYKIDIKSGRVIKNGKSISRVPQKFKNMPEFIKIFNNRDFEVFPSHGKQTLMTKRDFIQLFQGNLKQKDKAVFQFGESSGKPSISLTFIYAETKNQECWRLLQNDQLNQFLPIPKVYSQNFYAWYCQERHCIVFRRPALQNIGEISLVVFFQNTQYYRKSITHCHIISRQNYRSSMKILCDPNQKIFDKLILRNQHEKQSAAYDILSRIQKREYILELQSYENKVRKFWLHRYDSMFIQDEKNGLIPEGYKNYRVSETPFTNSKIPWKQQDNVSCLVLQKIVFNESTQLFHNMKILIPQWLCDEHGHIEIPDAQDINETKTIYAYDIHDHYGDIRGLNRLSQIHLATILASVNKNIRDQFSKMTPIQYSIKVLKSCFSNIPLSEKQSIQLRNLMAISACQQNQSLSLICYAIFKCAQQIQTLKEFKNTFKVQCLNRSNTFMNGNFCQQNFNDAIEKMFNIYHDKFKNRRLPLRQILPSQVMDILGVKTVNMHRGRVQCWRKQNKLKYFLPSNITEKYIGQYEEILKQWAQLTHEVVNRKSEQESSKDIKQFKAKKFPLQIQNPEQNVLLNEVQMQLKQSYQAYLKTKQHVLNTQIKPQELNKRFNQILKKMVVSKQQIQKIINGVAVQNQKHIDILTNFHPVISKFDFVNVLLLQNKENCFNDLFDNMFPDFKSSQEKSKFKKYLLTLIKLWTLFCIKINSCERILIILKHQIQDSDSQPYTDKISLFRQCESPRNQIQIKNYWICFEAEMKIQIWKSQYQTFKTLIIKNKSGSVSQLNMGQGKTQIIIPMISLELLYGDHLEDNEVFKNVRNQQKRRNKIPRVNLMESLINESRVNFYKFLSISAFNIPLTILPFDRRVDFTKQECLNSIVRSLGYFKNKMIILLDQSSTHSLMLKLREQTIKNQGVKVYNKQMHIFNRIDAFDIFDEVDAQLIPKKSFIYSVGKSSKLDEMQIRVSIASGLVETITRIVGDQKEFYNFFTYDESQREMRTSIDSGQFPKGLRLISNSLGDQEKVIKFRKIIFLNFLKIMDENQGFQFFKDFNSNQMDQIIKYIVHEQSRENQLPYRLNNIAKNVLYIFRGFLAYGVFQHCLYLRFNVHYGVPDGQRKAKKRLAVPYEAADIPSKKNDYAHPDVAILLTILAYYSNGLNKQQVFESFQHLINGMSQNSQARNIIYEKCYESLSQAQQKVLKIKTTSQIMLHSYTQRQRLYNVFNKNRKLIYFWLKNKVFWKDMIQFKDSITSSSWDHADVAACIGFSGTKDNCRLLPTYVQLIKSDNLDILGTDGKMLDLMIQNVLKVIQIGEGNESLWERFLTTVLKQKQQYAIDSIIDAGAILASKSLKNHIVPWLASKQKFIQRNFQGICFCSDNQWKVYKLSSHQYIDRGTSIPDNQTFVIYDQYRTRGADIKLNANVIAALTLSSTTTKDALMQAVGRLRKLGRNQKVIIFITDEVKLKLRNACKYESNMKTEEKVKTILQWTCLNSVSENEKYFLPNAKLAKIHFFNKQKPSNPYIDVTNTDLKTMYSHEIQYRPVTILCEQVISKINKSQTNRRQEKILDKLLQLSNKYGRNCKVKDLNFEAVCERQTQIVKQIVEQTHIERKILYPLEERQQIKLKRAQFRYNFKFSSKFQVSNNFFFCTASNDQKSSQVSSQLMNVEFVWLKKSGIAMITQREAHRLLTKQNVQFYQTDRSQQQLQFIAKLSDLSLQDKFIKLHKLQQALVHCKFFNGCSMFGEDEQEIIRKLISHQKDKTEKIKYFIEKRYLPYKFKNSTLEKILRDLSSMSQNSQNQNKAQKQPPSYLKILQSTQKSSKQNNNKREDNDSDQNDQEEQQESEQSQEQSQQEEEDEEEEEREEEEVEQQETKGKKDNQKQQKR